MADDDEKDPSLGSKLKDYLRRNPCVRDAAASGLVGKEIEKKTGLAIIVSCCQLSLSFLLKRHEFYH